MLEPRKRVALDGKVWWCVWDTEKKDWSTMLCFGQYKTRYMCQLNIDYYSHKYAGRFGFEVTIC